jgi:hypothetical protein
MWNCKVVLGLVLTNYNYLGIPKENLRPSENFLLLGGHPAEQHQIWIALASNTILGLILPMFRLWLIEPNAYLWPWSNIPGQNGDIPHPA